MLPTQNQIKHSWRNMDLYEKIKYETLIRNPDLITLNTVSNITRKLSKFRSESVDIVEPRKYNRR